MVSQAGGVLMQTMGMTPFGAFLVLGVLFLMLVVSAGSQMEHPPHDDVAGGVSVSVADILKDRAFGLLYVAMFAGLAAGFAVNANMKELYGEAGVQAGVRAVALFALANAAGRIVWGWLFDQRRSTLILKANLLFQALVLLLHGHILQSGTGLMVFAGLSGFNYGGILVLYASAAAERWGSQRISQVYGWLFSANIPAAVAPIVAGVTFDRLGSFSPVLWGIGGLMVAGTLALGLGVHLKGRPENKNQSNQCVEPSRAGSN
jgi:OFA family oxalate/formate antiporter-like MFS transporter